jgi:hypothetical protein
MRQLSCCSARLSYGRWRMTELLCAEPGCPKPRVAGSRYCPEHLAKKSAVIRNAATAVATVLGVVVGIVVKWASRRRG